MVIQWYPGHMNKALNMMAKEVGLIDAILYVLDARAPFSCLNPKFTKVVGTKPIIYVLNKCDMANDHITKQWQDYFSKKGNACVMLDSTQSGTSKKVITLLDSILKDKIAKYSEKNVTPTIRVMVLGVPNSGKSTLINNLSNKSKAITANKPGVTRAKQWVKIANGMEILDTPGTLWPAFDNNKVAKHLAYIGSIREQVLDLQTLAVEFIKDIVAKDATILENRYNIKISQSDDFLKVFDSICVARGFLLRGGDPDYDRTARAIITDFKQGRFGKVSLEEVGDINALLVNDRAKESE